MQRIDAKTRSSEWIGDLAVWLLDHGETNELQVARLRRNLQLAKRQELTPRQRQVLELYFEQGKNIPAIAQELGVACSTVSRTLKRARWNLYRSLRYGL